jgi:hypothetical protein
MRAFFIICEVCLSLIVLLVVSRERPFQEEARDRNLNPCIEELSPGKLEIPTGKINQY